MISIDSMLFAIYVLLPAAFANMAPVFAKNYNFLAYPIDGNATFRGKRLLGANKTVRGVFFAILVAIILAIIQYILASVGLMPAVFEQSLVIFIVAGFLLGTGAMLGDLVASFIKRQLDFKPGERMIIVDQIDWVIGAILCIMPFMAITLSFLFSALIIFFTLHIIIKHLGYFLKLENQKW